MCNWPGALNASLAYAMIALTRLAPDDLVLEIGPGLGSLTRHLASAARHVGRIRGRLGHLRAHAPTVGVPGERVLARWLLGRPSLRRGGGAVDPRTTRDRGSSVSTSLRY